ncbi:MAG: hypothetical protein ACRC1L_13450 [Prochlorococcaceae cyanobacterium]
MSSITLSATQAPATGPAPGHRDRDQKGERHQKLELRARIVELDHQARAAANAGEIEQCARAILAALDCERRLAATGPQVLQLIKPRS